MNPFRKFFTRDKLKKDRQAYNEYMQSDAWEKLRKRVFKRDGHKCKLCGGAEVLQCHHLTYKRFGKEKLSDLMTLCKDCHELIHGNQKPGFTIRWRNRTYTSE